MNKTLSLIATVLLLGACAGSSGPAIKDAYHQLPPPSIPQPLARPIADSLVVRPLRSDGLRQERALLYSEDGKGLMLHSFNFHFWTDTPPQIVEHRLVEVLRQVGAARRVAHAETGMRGARLVSGRLQHFEQLRKPGAPTRAWVSVELQLNQADSSDPLLLKSYAAEVTAEQETMDAIGRAFGAALDAVFGQFLRDLSLL